MLLSSYQIAPQPRRMSAMHKIQTRIFLHLSGPRIRAGQAAGRSAGFHRLSSPPSPLSPAPVRFRAAAPASVTGSPLLRRGARISDSTVRGRKATCRPEGLQPSGAISSGAFLLGAPPPANDGFCNLFSIAGHIRRLIQCGSRFDVNGCKPVKAVSPNAEQI